MNEHEGSYARKEGTRRNQNEGDMVRSMLVHRHCKLGVVHVLCVAYSNNRMFSVYLREVRVGTSPEICSSTTAIYRVCDKCQCPDPWVPGVKSSMSASRTGVQRSILG